MVKKWMKQLHVLWKNTYIDFDKIIYDILSWKYENYDYKELSWYDSLYRIRIWWYRIIFKKTNNDYTILLIWTRWDVYKKLKQIFW